MRMGSPAIFCIQEAKVPAKNLKNEYAAKDLGAIVPGYRSFWSFNQDNDPKKAAYQGVTTWVRDDVPVLGATQRVFKSSNLNEQGRALLTDHGAFVVLNIYAPFVGNKEDSAEVHDKLNFLQELGQAMDNLLAEGKRVVLCGDLNLTHRGIDQRSHRRLLWVDESGMIDIDTSSAVDKGGDKPVSAAGTDEQQEQASTLNTAPATSQMQRPVLPGSLGPLIDWVGRWVPVKDVADRLTISADVLAASGECLHVSEGGCMPWLRARVSPTGAAPWADTFAEVHPTALDRFTAWGQSGNQRYLNLGTRLDYIITDRTTFEQCVVRTPSTKLTGAVPPKDGNEEDGGVLATSAQAASNAATHFNGWHAAARVGIARGDGLSLQVDNMKLNDTQFPTEPQTGIIYTPPTYSDHVPVSAVFTNALLGSLKPSQAEAAVADKLQKETKLAQPWRGQPSMTAFFGIKAAKATSPAGAQPPSKVRKL